MAQVFKLYYLLFRLSIIRNLAYPKDFVIWSVIDIFWSIVTLTLFRVLFLSFPLISGWTFNEITLPLALVHLLGVFVWGIFYSNMKELASDINKGQLDLFLSKPMDTQLLVSFRYLNLNLIPTALIGIWLLVFSLTVNHVQLLLIPVFMLCSITIVYSLYLISTCIAFFTNRVSNIAEVLPHVLNVARYPTTIFNPFARFILTFIIPLAMVGIVPAQVLLGKISPINTFLPISLAFVLFFFSRFIWLFSLNHYSSASS